jgi:hypothetical protein
VAVLACGFSFLLVFDVLSSFARSTHNIILILAMVGGLANIAWYILAAIGLFHLGQTSRDDAK